jgi:hypothetical protein
VRLQGPGCWKELVAVRHRIGLRGRNASLRERAEEEASEGATNYDPMASTRMQFSVTWKITPPFFPSLTFFRLDPAVSPRPFAEFDCCKKERVHQGNLCGGRSGAGVAKRRGGQKEEYFKEERIRGDDVKV